MICNEGADRIVDTIDVYKQHTFQMSLGRFLELFQSNDRSRLYNILSLECSNSRYICSLETV